MPQALQVDWNMVQAMYLKGMTPKQISEQTGIKADSVSNRAHRYKWRDSIAKASAMVKVHNGQVEANCPSLESNALSKASALVREKLSNELLRAVDTLTSTKPSKRLETQLQRASVMQTITGAAKVIHGWSEGQSNPSVRISIMGSTSVQIDQDPRPAIDLPVVENKVEPQA